MLLGSSCITFYIKLNLLKLYYELLYIFLMSAAKELSLPSFPLVSSCQAFLLFLFYVFASDTERSWEMSHLTLLKIPSVELTKPGASGGLDMEHLYLK